MQEILKIFQDLEVHNSYEFVHADICNLKKVSEVFEEFQIDGVVNFAAESHVDRSIDGPEPFVQTNVVGTLRLLEAFKAYYIHRARIVNQSSFFACVDR